MELLESLYNTIGNELYGKFMIDLEKIASKRNNGFSNDELKEFVTLYLSGWSAALEYVKN